MWCNIELYDRIGERWGCTESIVPYIKKKFKTIKIIDLKPNLSKNLIMHKWKILKFEINALNVQWGMALWENPF